MNGGTGTSRRRSLGLTLGILGGGLASSLAAALWITARPTPPLPVLATLPPFELKEASGRRIADSDLTGRPWVASFIFTSCGDVCPRMTEEMKRLESQTRERTGLRLVSISVDPEHDTPEVLERYAREAGANRERWWFVTGEDAAIQKLAKDGFKLPAFPGNVDAGESRVIHSDRFILVDDALRVRGYYASSDPSDVARLRNDLQRLDTATGAQP